MKHYTQLTQGQRYQIKALLKMEHTQIEIANVLDVHRSTICRELRRNRGRRGYRPKQAHEKATQRRQHKASTFIRFETWELIEEKLRLDWSPEQIAGWLKRHGYQAVSHERIYQYVYADKRFGGKLYKHLRCQKKRRKRYGSYDRCSKLPNRVSIEERSPIVETRQWIGDWEVDTIIGKKHRQAIVALIERKSCFFG